MSRQSVPRYKILVLGAPSTGKSTLVKTFAGNHVDSNPAITIGAVVFERYVIVNGDRVILDIWDVEEPEIAFLSEETYFSGARGVIMVYDITQSDSLKCARKYCNKCTQYGLIHIPRILVGNKTDLRDMRRITKEKGALVADRIRAMHFEISAKNGDDVEDAFLEIAKMVHEMSDVFNWR